MMIDRRNLLAGVVAVLAASATESAPAQAAEPILTLRAPAAQSRPDTVQSSLGDLDALPQTAFSTKTPWHKGAVSFSGVTLKDYVAAFGVAAKSIRLVALNDYSVNADVAELIAADALLATRQDGKPMLISDKGPVFLVFPFDSRSELQHQTYYSRAVWQLTEIDAIP